MKHVKKVSVAKALSLLDILEGLKPPPPPVDEPKK